MFKAHNPPEVSVVGPFSWGVEIAPVRRILYISGCVGVDENGNVAEGLLEQVKLAFANLEAVLKSANLSPRNIVRTRFYMSREVEMTTELTNSFNAIRTQFMGLNRPASTWIYVHRLVDPRWLFEVDGVAAEFSE